MGAKSKIEWTDSSWTPIRARYVEVDGKERIGWHCEHTSEGCRFCYSEGMNRRLGTGRSFLPGLLGKGAVELFLDENMLTQPLRWKKPRMIFVCSMTDLFADFVPDEWIDSIFAVMASSPFHTFQVLTKRPERMRAYLRNIEAEAPARLRHYVDVTMAPSRAARKALTPPMAEPAPPTPELRALYDRVEHVEWGTRRKDIPQRHWAPWPLQNVWLGASVEDQKRADERREHLQALAEAGWQTMVSYEPALGSVDWTGWEWLSWLISGGESGPNARPSHPDWHRAARDFCKANGIPYFFKQWGEWLPDFEEAPGRPMDDDPEMSRFKTCVWNNEAKHWDATNGCWDDDDNWIIANDYWQPEQPMTRVGKKRAGRLLDGRTHDAMPQIHARATYNLSAKEAAPK